MNSQQVKEFRERWQAAAAVEAEEQRAASMTLRWQQTNAIFRLAMGLGLLMAEEDEVVWDDIAPWLQQPDEAEVIAIREGHGRVEE